RWQAVRRRPSPGAVTMALAVPLALPVPLTLPVPMTLATALALAGAVSAALALGLGAGAGGLLGLGLAFGELLQPLAQLLHGQARHVLGGELRVKLHQLQVDPVLAVGQPRRLGGFQILLLRQGAGGLPGA